MRRFALVLSCALFAPSLSARALASSAGTASGQPAPAALETISADEIKSDLYYIASDDMAGRDTPSPEQRIVARYIKARLHRLGIGPGAEHGYFFEYPIFVPRLRADESFARFVPPGAAQPIELALGADYFFNWPDSREFALQSRVVFCGHGGNKELETAKVAGKWALILDDGGMTGELERKLVAEGALGALMTPGAEYKNSKKKSYAERFKNVVVQTQRAHVEWPKAPKGDAKPKSNDTLFLYLPHDTATKLWPALTANEDQLPALGTELDGSFAHTRKLVGDKGTVMVENVCGFWQGSDPVLRNEVIIVSAHYDHEGVKSDGQVMNGADDNGSGTSTLLALAEALVTNGAMRRSVMLMWVSGEEKGLWGSQAWTEHPWLPGDCRPVCDINIDMVGRNASDYLLITPTAARPEYNGLVKLAEEYAPLEGFPKLGSCDSYWNRSDHANFAANLKIPVTFIFSDVHADYHKPGDDPEKIDFDKIRRVTRLVLRMIAGLQDDKLAL